MSTWTVLKDLVKKNFQFNADISDDDYLTCNKIWNEFNMKNAADYHDHYLEKDVLLLADIFENFIDVCSKFYKLQSVS